MKRSEAIYPAIAGLALTIARITQAKRVSLKASNVIPR